MSPRRRGGPAREGALPVKGRLAPPAPAAAGPFPEPLKQRDGRGAALPTAPRAGGGEGPQKCGGPSGRSGTRGSAGLRCPEGAPKEDFSGPACPRAAGPAGSPLLAGAPPLPSLGGSAQEAGVSPPGCPSPGAPGTRPWWCRRQHVCGVRGPEAARQGRDHSRGDPEGEGSRRRAPGPARPREARGAGPGRRGGGGPAGDGRGGTPIRGRA